MALRFLFLVVFGFFITLGAEASGSDETLSVPEVSRQLTIGDISPEDFTEVAVLQGLNKITAKSQEMRVDVGSATGFERLVVSVLKCWTSPPDRRPENKALIRIYEVPVNSRERREIFYGWMFSSSPGLSGLEHGMYDITLVECVRK